MVGRGLPKKGGFAGWGRPGEEDGVEIYDENDPNYVDEEEPIEEETEASEDAGIDQSVNPPKVTLTNEDVSTPTTSEPSQVEAH